MVTVRGEGGQKKIEEKSGRSRAYGYQTSPGFPSIFFIVSALCIVVVGGGAMIQDESGMGLRRTFNGLDEMRDVGSVHGGKVR